MSHLIRTVTGEEIDPYALDHGGKPTVPAIIAARRYLEQGDWRSGAALLQVMGQTFPDGVAFRYAVDNLDDTSGMSRDEQIAYGRRRMAVTALKPQIDRALETRPAQLTKAHFRGTEPWEVRDCFPGAVGTATAARVIDISEDLLGTWIRRGDVPTPPRKIPGRGPYLITPPVLAVLRRVRPYWQGNRWRVDPRGLWADEAMTHACPHCGGALVIETFVGAPHKATPTEPVASEAPTGAP